MDYPKNYLRKSMKKFENRVSCVTKYSKYRKVLGTFPCFKYLAMQIFYLEG